MVPPSVHPDTGERLEWEERGAPELMPGAVLTAEVQLLAGLVLVVRTWPGKGSHVRHFVSLALAGVLTRRLGDDERVSDIVRTVAELAGDEEARDRARDAATTIRAQRAGQSTTGLPTLLELLQASPKRKRMIAELLGSRSDAAVTEDGRARVRLPDHLPHTKTVSG